MLQMKNKSKQIKYKIENTQITIKNKFIKYSVSYMF